MRRRVRSLVAVPILMLLANTCAAQATGVVVEPFANLATTVQFEGSALALSSEQRTKLQEFVHGIYYGHQAPIHECDFDLFLISGARGTEAGALLRQRDALFERRLAYIKRLLTLAGVPERVGAGMRPSEVQPVPVEYVNIVSIEVRHWIHRPGEKFDQNHLRCKWQPSPK